VLAPAKLVAVAPPVARFELGEVAHPDCDWMLAQGDADDVVPPDAVLDWAAGKPRKAAPARAGGRRALLPRQAARAQTAHPRFPQVLKARKPGHPCDTGAFECIARRGTRDSWTLLG
jgi:hypothetical protein